MVLENIWWKQSRARNQIFVHWKLKTHFAHWRGINTNIVVEHSENCMLLSERSQTQFQSPKSQETFWSSKGWGEGLVHLCWGSLMEKVPARSFAKINIFTKSLEQLTIPPAHNYNFPIRKLPWKTHFGSIGMCFFNKAETFWFQPIFFTSLCNHSS